MINAFNINKLKNVLNDGLLTKIIKNSSIAFFGNTGASALNLLSFAIMVKQLGPEIYAILVLAQTYALVINDIFNVQTWEALVKFGSNQAKKSELGEVIKSNLTLDIISAFIATIFALILVSPVAKIFNWETNHVNYFLIYSISILFNITTLTIGVPRLFDKFVLVAKNQILFAILKLILVFLAAFLNKGFVYYFYIYFIIDMLTNVFLIICSIFLISKSDKNWWRGKIQFGENQIKFIWWINLRTIIRIPVRRLDILIINLIMSLKMVGIYKVYKEVAGILDRLSDPINQAIFPEYARLIGENKIDQSKDVAKKSIKLLFIISMILTIFMLILVEPAVNLVFGAEYLTHIFALYALIIYFWLVFFTTPINSLFIAAGFAKYSFYLVLISNTLYLFLAYFLGNYIGLYGIIFALIFQGLINQGMKIYLMKNNSSGWNNIIR